MVILFALEFVEGNTITRLYFMRLRRLARAALAEDRLTSELTGARAEQLASFTHFLDIPILLAIVSLGVLRSASWTQFVLGVVIAVTAASLLNYAIPRLTPGRLTPPANNAGTTGADLLLRRLTVLGLSPTALAQTEPKILHNLQRRCACCEHRDRCVISLSSGGRSLLDELLSEFGNAQRADRGMVPS
jgi:hypothetical protein